MNKNEALVDRDRGLIFTGFNSFPTEQKGVYRSLIRILRPPLKFGGSRPIRAGVPATTLLSTQVIFASLIARWRLRTAIETNRGER